MADDEEGGAADGPAARGRLRIHLGAAPGVGKTFAMLDEGWRRAQRGTDVVVAYVETHDRANTSAQLRDLEVIPRRKVTYRGQVFEEMDLPAVLARAPQVALVDELAHTNVPGTENAKRITDVQDLLAAGIDVVTTLNVQHLESLNDVVEKITGTTQHETVPDAVVRAADQVELVDMDPEALRRRMAHGNIYPADKIDAALGNYFRPGNLTALRELALLWITDRVDESLHGYMDDHGISGSWETRERVVVAVTGAATGERLIRRAARMAARTRGELLGVHIRSGDGLTGAAPDLLAAHRRLLEDLGGAYHEVVGADVASALTSFAEAERATQLVLGASSRSRWAEITKGSAINAVTRRARSFDVHIIAADAPPERTQRPARRARPVALSARRRTAGWLTAALGTPLLTVVLVSLRTELGLSADLMAYLMLVVVAAALGGVGPALTAAVASAAALNWFFTDPLHTLTIADPENVAALVGFLVVGSVISFLVTQAAQRSLASSGAAAEAEALARVAAGLLGDDDPLPNLVDRLRTTFRLDRASVEELEQATGRWAEVAASGPPAPEGRPSSDGLISTGADPRTETLPLHGGARLILTGPALSAQDLRVLHAFVAQLGVALEQRRLRTAAAAAHLSAESDALRTALLRSVSHDLRTPLSSIKAAVTSLLEGDIDWPAESTAEFLETIDQETDRLNTLVGNLLDMTRLEAGALEARPVAVGWDEIVAAALSSLSEPTERVEVSVPESLPPIVADPALLERSVANLVSNALRHTTPDAQIRITAGPVAGRVDLRIIDTGPGLARARRDQLFTPFQHLDDHSRGVGLGLAVSRGFIEALGGELEAEDTPGGGLTMVVRMPAA